MPYINSSAISYVEYNAINCSMQITFTSGGTYDYCGVPQHIYDGLINAFSAGTYYHSHIDGRYKC